VGDGLGLRRSAVERGLLVFDLEPLVGPRELDADLQRRDGRGEHLAKLDRRLEELGRRLARRAAPVLAVVQQRHVDLGHQLVERVQRRVRNLANHQQGHGLGHGQVQQRPARVRVHHVHKLLLHGHLRLHGCAERRIVVAPAAAAAARRCRRGVRHRGVAHSQLPGGQRHRPRPAGKPQHAPGGGAGRGNGRCRATAALRAARRARHPCARKAFQHGVRHAAARRRWCRARERARGMQHPLQQRRYGRTRAAAAANAMVRVGGHIMIRMGESQVFFFFFFFFFFFLARRNEEVPHKNQIKTGGC
jgi:hypothetical protein